MLLKFLYTTSFSILTLIFNSSNVKADTILFSDNFNDNILDSKWVEKGYALEKLGSFNPTSQLSLTETGSVLKIAGEDTLLDTQIDGTWVGWFGKSLISTNEFPLSNLVIVQTNVKIVEGNEGFISLITIEFDSNNRILLTIGDHSVGTLHGVPRSQLVFEEKDILRCVGASLEEEKESGCVSLPFNLELNRSYTLQIQFDPTTKKVTGLIDGELVHVGTFRGTMSDFNTGIAATVRENGIDDRELVDYIDARFDDFVLQSAEIVNTITFVPGMGASWNSDAMLRCKFENGYTWELASFAEDVYNPLLTALKEDSGMEIKEFYYDWRRVIPSNSSKLSNFIESYLDENEKTHFIGHSMGGLVGRAYIEKSGSQNKIKDYISVGSPHQGSPLAYPAWSGGEIWNDNFLLKIAGHILLRHCGGVISNNRVNIRTFIPSVENLLPVFEYLKDKKDGNFKPLSGMSAINEWLSENFNFNGVRVGTLSGKGFDTLKEIPVKDRNLYDEIMGNWEDGKPTGKTFTNEGDGTVLLTSSRLSGAENTEINQTHIGLVSSSQGITEIFNFLGLAEATPLETSFVEPTSAIIFISDDADLTVVKPNGQIKKDKDSLVGILNPERGDYLVILNPKSSETDLEVGYFLENGEVLWREFGFKGKLPQVKKVFFDPKYLFSR